MAGHDLTACALRPGSRFRHPARSLTDCARVPYVVARAFRHERDDPVDRSTKMGVVEIRWTSMNTDDPIVEEVVRCEDLRPYR